jgi:hypothetical protein
VSLTGALSGYRHQDLLTACAYAVLLTSDTDELEVATELKSAEGYRLDDLNLRGDLWRGTQIKSSEQTEALAFAHLASDRIKFRLDDVIAHYWAATERPTECRLVVTYPRIGSDLAQYVRRNDLRAPLIPGFLTERYVLEPEAWWPAADRPAYPGLANITREQFVEFAESFVIEVGCPSQSGDLSEPGPLELVLLDLLQNQIGIGRFPNAGRDPRDVAKALTDLARVSRDKWVSRARVIQQLDLRDDFGRAHQELPVDTSIEVSLDDELAAVIARLPGTMRLAVTGQPGAGKSWLVHALRQRLLAEGYAVASHYLHLGVTDVEQSARISSEVMYGSLIGQLDDAGAEAEGAPSLSAGRVELEARLADLASRPEPRPVVIIVDGLDHADRVSGRRQPGAAAELVDQLTELSLPQGVTLVVSSQPGPHLAEYLSVAEEHPVGAWSDHAITALTQKVGVGAAPTPMLSGPEQDAITSIICAKAAGNPLVATYLARTAIGLASGTIAVTGDPDIGAYLQETPQFDGTIEPYYRWLFDGLGDEGAKMCARAIAVLDFSVTAKDLREIHPYIGGRAEVVLGLLSPVLLSDAITGAVRVCHESFQRYVRMEAGDDLSTLLLPVIKWLGPMDFHADRRAFRGLVPLLFAAGREQEVVDSVGVDYVALAAAHNQPWDAVAENLEVAAQAAAKLMAWPDLSRLLQLARSAHFFYTWRLDGDDLSGQYGRIYAQLYGVAALASALMDGDRCTFPARPGLVLCLVCQQEGVPAPWVAYLHAEQRRQDHDDILYGHEAHLAHASVVGRISVAGQDAAADLVGRWIANPDEVNFSSDSLVRSFALVYGPAAAEALARSQPPGLDRAWALYGAADCQDDEAKARLLRDALDEGYTFPNDVLLDIHNQLDQAVAPISFERTDLMELTGQVTNSPSLHPSKLMLWREQVEVAAVVGDTDALANALASIPSENWYHVWLRFVLGISIAAEDEERLTALRTLTGFASDARTRRLYGATDSIEESLAKLLAGLDDSHWAEAVDVLVTICQTTTRDSRDWRSGPVTLDVLLGLLLTADTSAKHAKAVAVAQHVLRADQRSSQTYDFHAEDHMLFAVICDEAGRQDLAVSAWREACRCLTAYGRRKDRTVWELLRPLTALAQIAPSEVGLMLASTYTLTVGLRWHTDGRSTTSLLADWADIAAEVDPIGLVVHADTDPAEFNVDGLSEPIAAARAAAHRMMSEPSNPISVATAPEEGGMSSASSTLNPPIVDTGVGPQSDSSGPATIFAVPDGASATHVAALVRRWHENQDDPVAVGAVVDAVLAVLLQLARHDEAAACDLLTRIGRDTPIWPQRGLLAELFERLVPSSPGLAAVAGTLACTRSTDDWVWGNSDALGYFEEAHRLDAAAAERALALELVEAVGAGAPDGWTSHYIAMLARAGMREAAVGAWQQAHSVISYRMPSTGREDASVQRYVPGV